MFTGDASGRFLFRALHRIGWASDPDGRRVRGVYITAAVRCAPPGNRPTAAEMDRCRRWLEWELRLLARAQVFVALGRIAHDAVLRVFGLRPSAARFRHGAVHRLPDGRRLVDSYHPSRQNTQTGRLTPAMLLRALRRARALAARSG
jgi:uracil-DNA glycosylase family 4